MFKALAGAADKQEWEDHLMQLYYHKSPAGNFGDDLSPWLFSLSIPEWRDVADDDHCIFGVGTILTERTLAKFPKPIILGSGGTKKTVPSRSVLEKCDFISVRGPLTRDMLGLPHNILLGDPAIYIPRLLDPSTPCGGQKTAFVPHHLTLAGPMGGEIRRAVEQELDIKVISPSQDFRMVVNHIRSASLVLTESLHGAIIADTFRVPWCAVAFSPVFNSFKWLDWGRSVGIEPKVHTAFRLVNFASRWLGKLKRRLNMERDLGLDWREDKLFSRDRLCDEFVRVLRSAMGSGPMLSADSMVEERMDDFEKSIQEFRSRYKQ